MSTYTCPGCEETYDSDIDGSCWSDVEEAEYCQYCRDSDMNHAAVAHLVGPDYPVEDGQASRFYVGSLFREDQWGEVPSLPFSYTYVRTSAWRGYSVVSIDGWTEVLDGWTTGDWGDSISNGKRPFREWAEGLLTGEVTPPCNVAVIFSPTSNVFSSAVGIYVPQDKVDTFREWLDSDAEVLHAALT